MTKREQRKCESLGNVHFIIERQGIYDDGSLGSATCNRLNQFNHEQEMEFSQEEAADWLQMRQEEHLPMMDEEQRASSNICVEEFLSFFNPFPNIDSDPPPKITQRQVEERSSVKQQFEIASIEDSGGTTAFHPTYVEESIYPENSSIQHDQNDRSHLQSKDKSYNKNLACYISRSIRRLIFGKFQHSTLKHCSRRGLSYEQFQHFCADHKFSGINSIRSFYSPSDNVTQSKMGQLFRYLYQKILRRSYLRTVIEEGKMTKLDAYIEYKNKYLLNLQQNK